MKGSLLFMGFLSQMLALHPIFPLIRTQNDSIPIFPKLSALQNVYLPVTSFDFFVRLQIAHFYPNFVPKMLI